MTITFAASPLWLIGCLLIAVVLAVYAYRNTSVPVSGPMRIGMGALRGAALFLMLLLLLQPVALESETVDDPPVVTVLLDVSRSMPHIAGEEWLRNRLSDFFGTMQGLSDEAELQLFTFGSSVHIGGSLPSDTDEITFAGHRSNLGGALQHVDDYASSSIVLISDGHANSGPSAERMAERSLQPIHTVAAGDTTRPDMVQFGRIRTNERAFLNRETPVRVQVRSTGVAGETLTVRLSRDGDLLDEAALSPSSAQSTDQVDLAFTPSEIGVHSYQLEVIADRPDVETSTTFFQLRTVEDRRQVMLIAGGPSPAVSAFRQTIEREAGLELTTHIEQTDGSFYEGPIELPSDSVDLVVLSGYPTTRSLPSTLNEISQMLVDETPVLFHASPAIDFAALEMFIRYLPIQIDGDLSGWRPSSVHATGADHPAFTHASPAGGWELLPPVNVSTAGWRLRPEARALLSTTDDLAVVASREFSAYRSVAVMGTDIWQWHNLPPTIEDQQLLWRRFLRDLAQWTLADPADERVMITPSRADFHEEETVSFDVDLTAELRGPELLIDVTVIGPGESRTASLSAQGTSDNLADLPPGTYQYQAQVERGGESLGSDAGSFSIGGHDPEADYSFADGAVLSRIAGASGGQFSLLDNADEFIGSLHEETRDVALQREVSHERPFWQWPLLLAVILMLFSAEWFLRKRNGLP